MMKAMCLGEFLHMCLSEYGTILKIEKRRRKDKDKILQQSGLNNDCCFTVDC